MENNKKLLKEYLGDQMINKKFHFQCNCLFKINDYGVVKGYKISNNELVFQVEMNGKIIEIGENHPNLYIEHV